MGTEDEVVRMLAQAGTDRQEHTAAEPPVSPAAGEVATSAEPETVSEAGPAVASRTAPPSSPPVPEAVVFVKARETIRRPPLPSPSLYDAYLVKGPAPIPIHRQLPGEAESRAEPAEPGEQSRQSRSDALMVSSADALAALEAWSVPSSRHKPKAGVL